MTYVLFALRPIYCRDSRIVRAGELLLTPSLGFATSLATSGVAEPNNVQTAEAIEIALRVRAIAEA